jgi:P-type Ca2+ transporter type 2C
MGVDADTGLTVAEVERCQAEYGPNDLPTEPPPSMWVVAREQLVNPMNIMLLFVVAASFAIGGTIWLSRLRQGGDRLGAEDKTG